MRTAALVIAVLVVAGCASDSPDSAPTTTDTGSTTTSAPDDTTTSSTTTTTTSTSTTEVDTDLLADGSGCSPGEGALPDGRWFGYVERADDGSVEFDLACWFSGDAANAAALEDGQTEVPVPNDYYVRNLVSALRAVPVGDGVQVTWLEDPDPSRPTISDYPTWVQARSEREYLPGVWLTVSGGVVTEITEQYVP